MSKPNKTDNETSWDTQVETVEEPIITVEPDVIQKIESLTDTMGHHEWGGYLVGEKLTVADLLIPKQEVTSATWRVTQYPNTDKTIIGTVHSHHNMSSFTSQTDRDYLAKNHPVTLIYSTNDGLKGWVSIKLPDGSLFVTEARVLKNTNSAEHDPWIDSVKDRITVKPIPKRPGYSKKNLKDIHTKSVKTIDHCTLCGLSFDPEDLFWGLCVDCEFIKDRPPRK